MLCRSIVVLLVYTCTHMIAERITDNREKNSMFLFQLPYLLYPKLAKLTPLTFRMIHFFFVSHAETEKEYVCKSAIESHSEKGVFSAIATFPLALHIFIDCTRSVCVAKKHTQGYK